MRKTELNPESEIFYENFCEYGGIKFRLVSDVLFLKEIDFIKKPGEYSDNEKFIPAPAKQIMQFLESYFTDKSHDKFSILFRYNWKDTLIVKGSSSAGSIVLDMEGYTDKEVAVYRELIKIKTGQKISYGDLAARCGVPGGARFIGNTMAKNRFPVIVPCHRVIKSDCTIGNFSGGVYIKELLLRHEE